MPHRRLPVEKNLTDNSAGARFDSLSICVFLFYFFSVTDTVTYHPVAASGNRVLNRCTPRYRLVPSGVPSVEEIILG